MNVSPLTVLRLAAPGAPALREIARRMNVSATLLSGFELGQEGMSLEKVKLYARAVGSTLREVQRRFYLAQLHYHETKAREARAALAGTKGGSKRRMGRSGALAG